MFTSIIESCLRGSTTFFKPKAIRMNSMKFTKHLQIMLKHKKINPAFFYQIQTMKKKKPGEKGEIELE